MASTRVLLLHNRYRAAGGEERVVDQLDALLRSRGHAVARLERDSADAGAATAARGLLRGGLDERQVADAVRAHGAQIVHAHNVHPLLGWRALAAAREAGARVVLHLHNFRLVCAIGIGFRDDEPCARCHGRDLRPGVRLRCRGSLPEALVYAAGLVRQQPRLLAHSDAVITVGAAQLRLLREAYGVPLPQAQVLPNAVEAIASASHAGEGSYALVAGRLSAEKGFEVAVRAAVAAGVPLRVAGSGPELERLRALAAGADVRFLGHVTQRELAAERRGAALMLAPSRSPDACPMSVVEALADGLPVLGGDRGGVPELVGPEAVLPATDVGAWTQALRALWDDPSARARAGAAALARARAAHAPDVYYGRLMAVYAAALASGSGRDG